MVLAIATMLMNATAADGDAVVLLLLLLLHCM